MAGDGEDEVGYGKPPKLYQFQKGRSGNPRGRPRKSAGPSEPVIQKVLRRRVPVVMGGRSKRISVAEGVALQMVEQASRGKIGALRFLMEAQEKLEANRAESSNVATDQSLTVSQFVDMMEVIECLLAAGVLYMQNGGAFVFERSKIEAFITKTPGFMSKAGDLTYLLGSRAEDPEALVFGEKESLLDVFGRLAADADKQT